MKYQITSDNIEMSESMEVLAKEKLAKIEHKITHVPSGLKTARIVLNTSPNEMFQVKVLLTINGKEYFSEETDFTLEPALIKVVTELERMLKKEKVIATEEEWKEAREAKRLTEDDLKNEEKIEIPE